MEHRGFLGSVHYNDEDELLDGQVMFIRALISYEGTYAKSIKPNFHAAVDENVEYCEAQGKAPERPLKGSFNVRTSPDLHRRAAVYASEHSKKLNNVVEEALESFLKNADTCSV